MLLGLLVAGAVVAVGASFLARSPGAPAELKDGDELRLGNIVLRVVLGGVGRS